MYVVVMGYGRVGYHLVRALLAIGHEVLVIEKDLVGCESIQEELGSIALHGDGSQLDMLKKAGVARADIDLILGHLPTRVSVTYAQIIWQPLREPQLWQFEPSASGFLVRQVRPGTSVGSPLLSASLLPITEILLFPSLRCQPRTHLSEPSMFIRADTFEFDVRQEFDQVDLSTRHLE